MWATAAPGGVLLDAVTRCALLESAPCLGGERIPLSRTVLRGQPRIERGSPCCARRWRHPTFWPFPVTLAGWWPGVAGFGRHLPAATLGPRLPRAWTGIEPGLTPLGDPWIQTTSPGGLLRRGPVAALPPVPVRRRPFTSYPDGLRRSSLGLRTEGGRRTRLTVAMGGLPFPQSSLRSLRHQQYSASVNPVVATSGLYRFSLPYCVCNDGTDPSLPSQLGRAPSDVTSCGRHVLQCAEGPCACTPQALSGLDAGASPCRTRRSIALPARSRLALTRLVSWRRVRTGTRTRTLPLIGVVVPTTFTQPQLVSRLAPHLGPRFA